MPPNPSTDPIASKSSSPNGHKAGDGQITARLRRYGSMGKFNPTVTLVAVVKSCGTLEQSLGDMDKAADFLTSNPWVTGILEAAFHLKAFKLVRELRKFPLLVCA
ncbi:hypothetical protein CALVIDRAFT_540083 [Calocera viscosa TUFC12733]|uniref:Uncharacterized protein n=1 Tax=Calocera viscosa (strain TUFC12733) TaxID=1330018 RepID=A0A167J8Y3_CALVF|nr:hypothetical protein CALVIDRAFT_540083 [Calocera viscosa TUFC12733]